VAGARTLLRSLAEWLAASVLQLLRWGLYPPLALTYVGMLALVGGAGSKLGLTQLFWHEEPFTQIANGAAVMLVCGQLAVVAWLLESKTLNLPLLAKYPQLRAYARFPSLLALVVLASLALAGTTPRGWGALLGALVAFVLMQTPPLLWVAERLSRLVAAGLRPLQRTRVPIVGSMDARASVHTLQAAQALLIALVYGLAHCRVPLAALVVVAFAIMLFNAIWGFWAYWTGRAAYLFTLGSLLLLFALGGLRDGRLEGLYAIRLDTFEPATLQPPDAGLPLPDGAPQVGPVAGTRAIADLLDDRETLKKWKEATGQMKPLLVVVATSGGASRAALWTVTVLTELERMLPQLHRQIRIIAGASGGMVGAAHYVARIKSAPLADLAAAKDSLVRTIAKDALTPLVRELLLVGGDRGQALQRCWEESEPRLKDKFSALRGMEKQGTLPSLIFSPMMVEDGRRLLVSNLNLKPLTESMGPLLDPQDKCHLRPENCRLTISAVQLLEIFPAPSDVALSEAARMSATFPWVTAAVALPSLPVRRVVDAGYYDNYGVNMAALWIAQQADWLVANTGGVLLLQIRDERLSEKRNKVVREQNERAKSPFLSPITTPVEGVLSARESTMSFRNDELVQLLAARPELANQPHFFRTATFELPQDEPLSWYTTAASRDRIAAGMTPLAEEQRQADPCGFEWNQVTLARLCTWWHERTRAAGGPLPKTSCPLEPVRRCR
jgi:predicted acylesterase/phospholipase RssA